MASARGARLARAALPILAVLSFALGVGSVVAVAGDTLGYDYKAYVSAARRLLDGMPIYDPNVDVAGPFAIYLYPPPFAVGFIPFALLPSQLGIWTWVAVCIAMTVVAIAVMPVRASVRWGILLLAGLNWPVAYAIKLGQAGPLLLLVFAVGWRFVSSQPAAGLVGGMGALIKVQPALLLAWAVLTRRYRAAGVGGAVIVSTAIVTLPLVGTTAWFDYVRLLGRVSEPITTPHNMTVGAVAWQSGLTEPLAAAFQVAGWIFTIAVWIFASRRRSAEIGYLATIVASQLLSPVLWDHYALLLLLPVAWLLEQRHWWASVIPLATSILFLSVTPPAAYPVAFVVCLLAPTLVARRPAT